MPCIHTRSQSTDEPSSDGPLLRVCAGDVQLVRPRLVLLRQRSSVDTTDDTAGDRVSPRSQQLAATQAAAQVAYDEDKRYDEETLAAAVVVYDTGRKGTAQLPPIRGLTRDKHTGEWRVLTKEGKTLADFRSSIVGVHARGWDVPMWDLSTEQATEFDQFQWLLQPDAYERVLRGCATMCAGGLATLRTQQARVLAITHLLEMLHTPEALALKERLIAYYRFLEVNGSWFVCLCKPRASPPSAAPVRRA